MASYTAGTNIVKICGITQIQDAILACQAGANLIGIIFVPSSKRYVSDLQQAKDIVEAVWAFGERQHRHDFPIYSEDPSPIHQIRRNTRILEDIVHRRPLVVGVFQNQDPSYIQHVVNHCGLDLVQLHGQEGMSACSRQHCGVPAIRVVDIPVSSHSTQHPDRDTVVDSILLSLTGDPFMILLDTTVKGSAAGGGTGVTFDWTIAEAIQNRGLPVVIAGGLNPDNIDLAVRTIRPWGVDVSSGVELSPGRKDGTSMHLFVARARDAAMEASKGF
jgi:anthranilate synthase/indole-3-glycerol phosphate synthase/phosphoribosylanthranilate isomerase